MSSLRRQIIKLIYSRILHADDTPHRIALGVAVGTFVGLSPTMGFQTVIAVAIAAALRANKAVCIPLVWITNPLTFAPIYFWCWRVGAWIVPGGIGADASQVQRVQGVVESFRLTQLLEWGFWARLSEFIVGLGAELWVGCGVVGAFFAVAAYGASRWGVAFYRARRVERITRRSAFRARRTLGKARVRPAMGVRQ